MSKVLFLNHTIKNCGIHQEGKRVFELISKSKLVEYIYFELDRGEPFLGLVDKTNPDFIIFNWGAVTMLWYPVDIYIPTKAKQFFILHDPPLKYYYDKYLIFGERNFIDHRVDENNVLDKDKYVILPRPIYDYDNKYPKNKIPVIGSFGLLSSFHKGFDEITRRVNAEFDEAVINLHFPWAEFCDAGKTYIDRMVANCKRENIKPGIKLNLTHHLMNDFELLDFLAKNDINIFYYRPVPQIGLSSSIDAALAVNRPLAVTNVPPFRHVYKEDIDINKNLIASIMNLGTKPLQEFYDKWSAGRLCSEMEKLFI